MVRVRGGNSDAMGDLRQMHEYLVGFLTGILPLLIFVYPFLPISLLFILGADSGISIEQLKKVKEHEYRQLLVRMKKGGPVPCFLIEYPPNYGDCFVPYG